MKALAKLCSYFPFPGKVWCNGHEWAKRQATAAGLTFTELANGFASCSDPARLQAICDRLGPEQIQAFFDRWIALIPTPFGPPELERGYWWELSMRQVETSCYRRVWMATNRPVSATHIVDGERRRIGG